MELFISLFIYLIIVAFEWAIKLVIFAFQLIVWLISIPFEIAADSASKKRSYSAPRHKNYYDDPIEKAMDRFENHPEDMDLEDEFWIDEILGDD